MKWLPGVLLFLLCINNSPLRAQSANNAASLLKPNSLIVNQAADAIVGYLKLEKPLGGGATREMAETALLGLVDQYESTRVSHVFWNVCYQRAAYRSDAWASYWDVPDPDKNTSSWPRKYYELHRLGIDDAFALLIPRCRERGISPWVSLRMNDMHYNHDPHRMNPFWNDNPQFWNRKKPGFDNGFDFTRTEVRTHYMKLVEEVMTRWDVDGVELDWMRFPNHFQVGNAEKGRAALTAFMRETRAKSLAAAQRLGHPVGIAVRVPSTPEFAFELGLDVETWAREGLVDVLIPCSRWRPSFPDVPVQQWRTLVGQDCRIVPGTDLWIRGTRGGGVAATGMAPIRGFTASMLDRGADAIYLFNHFGPTDMLLSSLTIEEGQDRNRTLGNLLAIAGDPAKALTGPRRHVLTFHDPAPPNSDYQPPLPALLAPAKPVQFRLHIGPTPKNGTCTIRVGLDDSEGFEAATLKASVNGTAAQEMADMPRPPHTKPADHGGHLYPAGVAPRLLQFKAAPKSLLRAYNDIELELTEGGHQRVIWLEIVIDPQ